MRKLFNGRYGLDAFSFALLIFAMPFLINRRLFLFGLVLIGYAVYRALSRNFANRQRELSRFTQLMHQLSSFFSRILSPVIRFAKKHINRYKKRKIYRYIKCKECKKCLRVPRNKGKIRVTCPQCKNHFIIVS